MYVPLGGPSTWRQGAARGPPGILYIGHMYLKCEIRAAKTKSRVWILVNPFYESLYVNLRESKGFTSGARQTNPGFTESRGWQ